MSSDWSGYAREISGDFIYRQEKRYDLMADLPRFVDRLSHVFDVYERAPFGPYLLAREYKWRDDLPEWLYQEIPREASPDTRPFQSLGWRYDCTAGPSVPRAHVAPMLPPLDSCRCFQRFP